MLARRELSHEVDMKKALIVLAAISSVACAPTNPQALKNSSYDGAVYHEEYVVNHNFQDVYHAYNELIQSWRIAWMWNNPSRPAHLYADYATISVDYHSVMTHHVEIISLGENETVVQAWQYLGQDPTRCDEKYKYTIQCLKDAL